MTTEQRKSAQPFEHDHTQLDVLFEDLHAVALAAFDCAASGSELELLEDARTNWTYLLEEIARHFGKEERKLFAVLAQQHPELKDAFSGLAEQHQVLRKTISEIGTLLKGTPEEVAARLGQFQSRWGDLSTLWSQHSDTEWEILQGVGGSGGLTLDESEDGGHHEHG